MAYYFNNSDVLIESFGSTLLLVSWSLVRTFINLFDLTTNWGQRAETAINTQNNTKRLWRENEKRQGEVKGGERWLVVQIPTRNYWGWWLRVRSKVTGFCCCHGDGTDFGQVSSGRAAPRHCCADGALWCSDQHNTVGTNSSVHSHTSYTILWVIKCPRDSFLVLCLKNLT